MELVSIVIDIMFKCEICQQIFDKALSMLTHVRVRHGMSSKEYYDEYFLTENEHLCKFCKTNETKLETYFVI